MGFLVGAMNGLKSFVMLFQSEAPAIHNTFYQLASLYRDFLGCFLKPEVRNMQFCANQVNWKFLNSNTAFIIWIFFRVLNHFMLQGVVLSHNPMTYRQTVTLSSDRCCVIFYRFSYQSQSHS